MIQSDLPSGISSTIITANQSNTGMTWYKIGEINTANRQFLDEHISFLVISGHQENGYDVPPSGILKIHLRTNDQCKLTNQSIQWLVTTYNNDDLSKFCLEIKNQTLVEFWVGTVQYQSYHFKVLDEGTRFQSDKLWTLYTNPQVGAKPTEGYTEYRSTVAKLTASS